MRVAERERKQGSANLAAAAIRLIVEKYVFGGFPGTFHVEQTLLDYVLRLIVGRFDRIGPLIEI